MSGNSKKWEYKNARNSRDIKLVSPRLSLLVAIDNYGAIYVALSQVNTDHNAFQLFLTKLTAKLKAE